MKPPLQTVPRQQLPSWPATQCPSCDAAASGKFCAACGETLRHHLPSAQEFIHEFIGHYIALEGKLVQTLTLLLLRPGRLTVAFLQGRRLPYIAPLRLYLTLSLVMFALIKWYGVELPQLTLDQDTVGAAYSHRVVDEARGNKPGTATLWIKLSDGKVAPGEVTLRDSIRSAIAALGTVDRAWMTNLRAFMAAPAEQQSTRLNHGFLANFPYMLIAAVPLFAWYLQGLYRGSGRVYGEHLVFALHANAFAFLLASVMIVIPGNVMWIVLAAHERLFRLITPWDYFQLLPFAWLLAYLPGAMRRVYGGAWPVTACKWLVLLAVHLLVIAVLTVAAELIGVVATG